MDGWNTYTVVSFWSKKSIFRCFCCQFQGGFFWPQKSEVSGAVGLDRWGVWTLQRAELWKAAGRLIRQLPGCYYVGVNCRIFPLFFTDFCGFPEKTGVKICPNYLTQTQLTELPEQLFGFARRCYFLDAFEDFLQVGIHWGNPMGLLWKTHNCWLLKIHLNGNLAGQIQRPSAARSIFSLWQCFLWQMSQFLTLHRLGWKRDKTGSVESE